MYSDTQTLEGVTSLLPNGKHIIMWDLEGCLKEQAEETLMKVQISHILPDIFLFSENCAAQHPEPPRGVRYTDFIAMSQFAVSAKILRNIRILKDVSESLEGSYIA